MVGRVHVTRKGVIIVDDECLGSNKGILGMNIIQAVWSALTQENHLWLSAFKTTMLPLEGWVWAQAFAKYQQFATRSPPSPTRAWQKYQNSNWSSSHRQGLQREKMTLNYILLCSCKEMAEPDQQSKMTSLLQR